MFRYPPDEKVPQGRVALYDAATDLEVLVNRMDPIQIKGDGWNGQIFFAHKLEKDELVYKPSPGGSGNSSNPFSDSAPDKEPSRATKVHPDIIAMFEGKKRFWEIQLQMQFTSNLPRCSDVMFTFEFPTKAQIGGAIVGLAVRAVKLLGVMVGFGEWGCCLGPSQPGEMEKAWVGFPILNANQITVSDSWDKAPELGPHLRLPNDRKKDRKFEFEAGKVYTIKHWTMYVDFVRWQLCNFPGMPASSMGNMLGDAPSHAPLYMSIWRKSDDFYYMKTCVTNVLHAPRVPPLPSPPSSKASMYSDAYTSDDESRSLKNDRSIPDSQEFNSTPPAEQDALVVPDFSGRSVQDGNVIELTNEDFIVWISGGLHSSRLKCCILLAAVVSISAQYWVIAVCCLVAAIASEWPKDIGDFHNRIQNISRKQKKQLLTVNGELAPAGSPYMRTPARRMSSSSVGRSTPAPMSDAGISSCGFARSPPPLVPYSPDRPAVSPFPGVADVAVPSYRIIQGAKRHVLYSIRYGNYLSERRYSDFEILRNRLTEIIKANSDGSCFGFIGWSWLPPLPQKFMFAQFDTAKLERRRLDLQEWLRLILTPKFVSQKTHVAAHTLLCQFFGMPEKRLVT